MFLAEVEAPARAFVEIGDQSVIHPLGVLALVVLAYWVLTAKRANAIVPILLATCFIASGQRIVIAGLDFTVLRLLVLVGFLRVLWRSEYAAVRWQRIDFIFPVWVLLNVVSEYTLWGDFKYVIFALGNGFDGFGIYLLFRILLRDWNDQRLVFRTIEWIAIPVAIAFLAEWVTQYNAFSVFGGVPKFTDIRDGKARCQGAFAHSILAGVFWASLLPLILARLWDSQASKLLTSLSIASVLWIVFACSSSTPILAVGAGLFAGTLIVFRHHMRLIRWSVFSSALVFHLLWQHPIWALFAKVNILSGSTGYHRYALIDAAVNNWSEWFWVGTKSTAHWGWGLQDVTNQYILEATHSGFFGLLAFTMILIFTFSNVGRIWRAESAHPRRVLAAWALGTSLFVHCISFTAVSYFGQIYVVLYLVVALSQSLAAIPAPRTATVPQRVPLLVEP